MTTTTETRLHWNANGQVSCETHLVVGGSLYRLEGWAPIHPDLVTAEDLACDDFRCTRDGA